MRLGHKIAAMTLEQYLSEHKLTQQEFAEQIGITQSRVSRILSGSRGMPDRLLQRIYEVTNGDVTPNDLIIGAQTEPTEAA